MADIDELIQSRAAVLEKAKTKVTNAQAIKQMSAKVLKENTLNSLKEVLTLTKENFNQNQALVVASATSANKTPSLQQLSFIKPKEQTLTRAEYRNVKQAEKPSESLPHTGEQQSIWLSIIGLFMAADAISFKNKKRKNNY